MLEIGRQRGFGWVEALIALAILAILAVAAVPSLRSSFQAARFRNALRDLSASLELARGEAIRRNGPMFVSIVDGPAWCVGVGTSPCACGACDTRTVDGKNYPDVLLKSAIPDGGYQIDPANGIASQAGVLAVSIGSYKGTVTVSRLARASVCQSNCGSTP